ncbi:unnamed protein product, partial [Closterium sp. Naga37s-1]
VAVSEREEGAVPLPGAGGGQRTLLQSALCLCHLAQLHQLHSAFHRGPVAHHR